MSATAAQPKTADRVYNRAPKGGFLDVRTGVYYRGGCFIPTLAAHELAKASKPATLTGSWLQVSWATRLRTTWLARLDAKLSALRVRLEAPETSRKDATGIRAEVMRLEGKRWRVWSETDAATVIGRHVAQTMAASGVQGLRLAVCA